MRFIQSRLPEKTELQKVFWLTLIYSNSFGFIAYAKQMNLLIDMFNVWDLLGVLSYVFLVSALEAGTVFLFLIALSMILPKFLFRDKFVQWAVIWLIAITSFLLPFVLPLSSSGLDEYNTPMLNSDTFFPFFRIWLLFFAILLTVKWMLNKEVLENKFNLVVDRLSVLGKFYLALDSSGLILIIVRNIFQLN